MKYTLPKCYRLCVAKDPDEEDRVDTVLVYTSLAFFAVLIIYIIISEFVRS